MSIHRTGLFAVWLVATAALLVVVCGCPSSSSGSKEVLAEKPAPPAPSRSAAIGSEPAATPGVSDSDRSPSAKPGEGDLADQLPAADAAAAPLEQPKFGPNPLRDDVPAVQQAASAGKKSRVRVPREPFDPIEVNKRYFVDWPAPKLAILISGRQDGYLEPCGCAGKERMKGGLMRRCSLFEELRSKRGWPTAGVDVGGLIKDSGRQAEMKFMTTVEAMRMMKYDAMALGTNDLKLRADQLFSVVANSEAVPSPFVSANVGVFGFAHGMSARQRVIERGGIRVGVTSVLGKKYQEQINNTDVVLTDPVAALTEVVPALKKQCDLMILLAHATREESRELAREFPDFDVVVTAGGPPEPPDTAELVEGTRTMLVEVGTKGMAAVVLGIYDGKSATGSTGGRPYEIRYQRVIIDSRYTDSPQVKALFAAYQEQLRQAGLEGLGIRPAPLPASETLGRFVGSEKCESCHEESDHVWKKSLHSDAWKTLVNLDPPRNFDPECIACHVIGWNPTYYFPYQGGFLSEAKTPRLVAVGCESCHGPGQAHVEAESGNDTQRQEKFQQAAVITKEEAKKRLCLTCHDGDNSPDFDFDTYWPLVEHYEDWGDEEEK